MSDNVKKRGRPRIERTHDTPLQREDRVSVYLTSEDARYLRELAEGLEFRSSGSLITALLERLIIGGFSPMAFLKTAFQVQDRCKKLGVSMDAGFYFGIRPLPALEDEPNVEQKAIELLERIEEKSKK